MRLRSGRDTEPRSSSMRTKPATTMEEDHHSDDTTKGQYGSNSSGSWVSNTNGASMSNGSGSDTGSTLNDPSCYNYAGHHPFLLGQDDPTDPRTYVDQPSPSCPEDELHCSEDEDPRSAVASLDSLRRDDEDGYYNTHPHNTENGQPSNLSELSEHARPLHRHHSINQFERAASPWHPGLQAAQIFMHHSPDPNDSLTNLSRSSGQVTTRSAVAQGPKDSDQEDKKDIDDQGKRRRIKRGKRKATSPLSENHSKQKRRDRDGDGDRDGSGRGGRRSIPGRA